MRQIILVLSAMALGLLTGWLTGGLGFSTMICFAAGLFLVTPSLFAFETSDLRLARKEARPIALSLLLNFVVLVAAALAIGYASRDLGIAAALLLLAMLPGGGMVMMWIRSSGADVKLGFLLSMVHLALILPVMLVFDAFPAIASPWFPAPTLAGATGFGQIRIPPFAPFLVLIVVPFLLSRWAKESDPELVAFAERNRQTIASLTIFGIVFYLFSLRSSQLLFAVPLPQLGTAFLATAAFYAVAIGLAELLTPKTAEGRAVYWHLVTRYITLALILASFSISIYGPTFILPIMLAYFFQFGAAGVLRARMQARAAAATPAGEA